MKREIPWDSDLVYLRYFVVEKCTQATKKLLADPSSDAWAELWGCLFHPIATFNKRCVPKLTELTVDAYGDKWIEGSAETDATISSTEKSL